MITSSVWRGPTFPEGETAESSLCTGSTNQNIVLGVINTLYTPPNTPVIYSLTQSTPDKAGRGRPSGVGAEGQRNTSEFIGTQFIMVFSYISPPSVKVKVAWAKSDGKQPNLSRVSQSTAIQDGHDATTITCNNSCSPQHTMSPGFLMETGHKCTICSASSRTPDSQGRIRGSVLTALFVWTVEAERHGNASSPPRADSLDQLSWVQDSNVIIDLEFPSCSGLSYLGPYQSD